MEQILNSKNGANFFADSFKYNISYIIKASTVIEQSHSCFKIVISLDDLLSGMIDGEHFVGLQGLVINTNVPHTFTSRDTAVLINFIKIDGFHGKLIESLLHGKKWLDLYTVMASEQFIPIFPANFQDLTNEVLVQHVHLFLDSFLLINRVERISFVDDRISLALDYIDDNLQEFIELGDISSLINLSMERTRHLFVEQTGISFSQYILWKRIQKTLKMVAVDKNKLIDASLRSGFGDQSHFNRALRRILHLAPSQLIRGRVLL